MNLLLFPVNNSNKPYFLDLNSKIDVPNLISVNSLSSVCFELTLFDSTIFHNVPLISSRFFSNSFNLFSSSLLDQRSLPWASIQVGTENKDFSIISPSNEIFRHSEIYNVRSFEFDPTSPKFLHNDSSSLRSQRDPIKLSKKKKFCQRINPTAVFFNPSTRKKSLPSSIFSYESDDDSRRRQMASLVAKFQKRRGRGGLVL